MDINEFVQKMKRESKGRPEKAYKCKECRDSGYYKDETGQMVLCQCERKRIAAAKLKRQGFKAGEMTLAEFNGDNAIAKRMKQAAEKYIAEYPAGSMAVLGQVGAGKTHLVIGIAQTLMDQGRNVVYMPYVEVLAQLRQSIFNATEYGRIMQGLKTCELLVIDDFLKGNTMPNDLSIMFELINYRYLNKLNMVISSEKLLDELIEIDEATGTRIGQMTKGNRVQITRDIKRNRRIVE